MRIFGYVRVSTLNQASNGNGIEVQRNDILNKYKDAIIVEEQYTGSTRDRPIFKELIKNLESGDRLVVNKLDRLARNVRDGKDVIEELFNRNISIDIMNMSLLENTTHGKLMLHMFLAIAEAERDVIIERTKAGKDLAKLKPGYKEGRPPNFTEFTRNQALAMLTVNGGSYSYSQVARLTGISRGTLLREVKKMQC